MHFIHRVDPCRIGCFGMQRSRTDHNRIKRRNQFTSGCRNTDTAAIRNSDADADRDSHPRTLAHADAGSPSAGDMEWAVYPYANLADPQNTDKRIEILVRNPNGFPVRVNMDEVELRLLNAAEEIVYTNNSPTFYIWEGSWILGGETAAMSACACFDTNNLEKQAWESLELVAPSKQQRESPTRRC